MKKERAIIIKDPRLRKTRNALGTILKLWLTDIHISLVDERDYYFGRDDKKFDEVKKKITQLKLLNRRSICTCSFCGRSDRDMIFIPDLEQWICIGCNHTRVYFRKLEENLELTRVEINQFFNLLEGEYGINLTRFGSNCHGHESSKRILAHLGVDKKTQKQFLELCEHLGGHCDCEIILNVKPHFFKS